MFEIARKGLFGRKKESLMLLSILFLSFSFSILTSTFYSNSERAKAGEREAIYGRWQYAAFGQAEGQDPFTRWTGIAERGTNRLIGRSQSLGTLASFDEGFRKLSNLALVEGRLPLSLDEVALEHNQLGFFEMSPTLGSKVIADTEVLLFDREAQEEPEQIEALMKEAAAEQAAADLSPALQDFISQLYGRPFIDPALQLQFRQDLAASLSVAPGNRQRRHGLENFEDTILIPSEEHLLFSYSADLPGLIDRAAKDRSDSERTALLNAMNDLLIRQLSGETGKEGSDLSIRGEAALPYKRSYIVRRTLTVTGIYSSISSVWLGEPGDIPTSLVTEETARRYLEDGLLRTEAGKGRAVLSNTYVTLSPGAFPPAAFGPVLANDLAYPQDFSTDTILAFSILGFIFSITLFGVFQLYLSQLSRRLRKLALFRAIGSSVRQIQTLLIWELVILVGLTLPLALALGIGAAWLLSSALAAQHAGFSFRIDPALLSVSLLTSLAAVALGVLYPLRLVTSIPLTGAIAVGKPKAAAKARRILGKRERPVANLRQVLAHHSRFSRRQSFLTKLTYGVICSALLLSLLLSFLAFTDYRDSVAAVSMPDYEITLNYALQARELTDFEEELKETGGFADIQHLIGRKNGQLTTAGGFTDPLYAEAKEQVPAIFVHNVFVTEKDSEKYPAFFSPGARKVNVYGMGPDSSLFQVLNQSLGGLLETQAFQSGRSALLLYPAWMKLKQGQAADESRLSGVPQDELIRSVFEQQGTLRLSFDFRAVPLLETITPERAPREIRLTFHSEEHTETERNVLPPTVHTVEVMKVVSELPEFGVWPFSQTLEHPVILGSYSLVRSMIQTTRSAQQMVGIPPSQTLVPTLHGTQKTALWADQDKSDGRFVKIQQIASRYGGRAKSLYADKVVRFNAALRISTLVWIAAFLIGLTALQIQLNISKARTARERVFIGTLQSLGVSARKLKRDYLMSAMGYSVSGAVFAHILLALVLLLHLLTRYPANLVTVSLLPLLKAELWLYPWSDHLAVTFIFIILGMLIYYLPLRRHLKSDPIHNIRSL